MNQKIRLNEQVKTGYQQVATVLGEWATKLGRY